jgi:hypothetical protein
MALLSNACSYWDPSSKPALCAVFWFVAAFLASGRGGQSRGRGPRAQFRKSRFERA